MKAYADTGLLCSLYTPDAHTAAAVARMGRTKEPLPLIWLHQLELRNALRRRVFRGEITAVQRDAALNAFLADAAGGIYAAANPLMGEVIHDGSGAIERIALGQARHAESRYLACRGSAGAGCRGVLDL